MTERGNQQVNPFFLSPVNVLICQYANEKMTGKSQLWSLPLFSNSIFTGMKQQEFEMKTGKVIVHAIPIILFFVIQIVLNLILSGSVKINPLPLVLVNLGALLLNVPAILLFFNYYHYSKNKKVILTYDKITLYENGIPVKDLLNSSIRKIEKISTSSSKLPWHFFDYFILEDDSGNQIIITCFMMELVQLRMSTLARKIPSGNYTAASRFYPRIP
jgi:hypothetical protein